jgi:phosphohistidine phosphatase
MDVYLIRHGIAIEPDTVPTDAERYLTKEGIKKTDRVSEAISQQGIKFDLILSSPLVRARQTAKILLGRDLSQELEICDHLAPSGNLESWLGWWETRSGGQGISSLALVGHEPNLGEWAELLLFGQVYHKLIVKKAGIVVLKFPRSNIAIAQANLAGLLSPKYFCKLV